MIEIYYTFDIIYCNQLRCRIINNENFGYYVPGHVFIFDLSHKSFIRFRTENLQSFLFQLINYLESNDPSRIISDNENYNLKIRNNGIFIELTESWNFSINGDTQLTINREELIKIGIEIYSKINTELLILIPEISDKIEYTEYKDHLESKKDKLL